MLAHARTTDPATEPVTATELDTFLRGDGALEAAESDFLDSLIASAREYVERHTRRALINQTWTLMLDGWPASGDKMGWWDGVREGAMSMGQARSVELPMAPLVSVTSIKTFAQDNTETTFNSSNYYLNTLSTPGEIILNDGTVWPTFTRSRNGIEIVYVAGYGANATDVPSPLRTAVKQLAGHWYENREYVKTQSDQNQAPAPMHIAAILDRYVVKRL